MSRRFQPLRRRTIPTTEALDWLDGDYPEPLKQRIYLASRGALRGPRKCLACGKLGYATRVYVPSEALRAVEPDVSGVEAYWVCQSHSDASIPDDQIPALLAARRRAVRR
jgi:hypothetical protein